MPQLSCATCARRWRWQPSKLQPISSFHNLCLFLNFCCPPCEACSYNLKPFRLANIEILFCFACPKGHAAVIRKICIDSRISENLSPRSADPQRHLLRSNIESRPLLVPAKIPGKELPHLTTACARKWFTHRKGFSCNEQMILIKALISWNKIPDFILHRMKNCKILSSVAIR